MREICQSGSEGGGAETNRLSLPLLNSRGRSERAAPGSRSQKHLRRASGDTMVTPLTRLTAEF